METTREVRVRKVNNHGKGVIQNSSSSIQRRRVQTMLFKLQAITDRKYKFPFFRMVNFTVGKRHVRKICTTAGLASTYAKKVREEKKEIGIVQISLRCTHWSDENLFHVVAHELGHVWLNLRHDESCKLMSAKVPSNLMTIEESEKYFKMLSDKFQETLK